MITSKQPLLEYIADHLPEDWKIVITIKEQCLDTVLFDPEGKEVGSCLEDGHEGEEYDQGVERLVNYARVKDGVGKVEWLTPSILKRRYNIPPDEVKLEQAKERLRSHMKARKDASSKSADGPKQEDPPICSEGSGDPGKVCTGG